ncbi:MAG: hypothetical protein U9O98_11660 [Asgard group archaeon]|nr:hypothetical protein [Asgard group archaeon]
MSTDKRKKTSSENSQENESIDFASLTKKEQDELILSMKEQEIMENRATIEAKEKSELRLREEKRPASKSIAPGFGWVAFKMSVAMTFSMTFIFVGPIVVFMALFKTFGERGVYDWYDLLFGVIGLALIVIAVFLFRYLIKD